MDAKCLNDDCEKDTWNLRKHPSEYSRGVMCPECGTSRVELIGDEPEPQPQAQQAQAQPQAQVPATAEPQPQGGEMMAADQDAVQHGLGMGQMLAGISSNDPEEKAQATGQALQAAGAAVARYGQSYAQKEMEERNRAKNAMEGDITVADDYVSCPECSTQLTNIPDDREFPCPSCGTMLEYHGA